MNIRLTYYSIPDKHKINILQYYRQIEKIPAKVSHLPVLSKSCVSHLTHLANDSCLLRTKLFILG